MCIVNLIFVIFMLGLIVLVKIFEVLGDALCKVLLELNKLIKKLLKELIKWIKDV